jgi:hypothetical protein
MLVIDEMGRRKAAREICADHTPRQLEEILTWCEPWLRPALEKHLQRLRAQTVGLL